MTPVTPPFVPSAQRAEGTEFICGYNAELAPLRRKYELPGVVLATEHQLDGSGSRRGITHPVSMLLTKHGSSGTRNVIPALPVGAERDLRRRRVRRQPILPPIVSADPQRCVANRRQRELGPKAQRFFQGFAISALPNWARLAAIASTTTSLNARYCTNDHRGQATMPRIRNIKPEFFTSESVAELPLRARLTWIGLWTHCDNYGRARDNAKLVKAAVWPLDAVTLEEVEHDLKTLAEHERIVRYEVAGRRYLGVTNWEEHQYGAGKGAPLCPPPPAESQYGPHKSHRNPNTDQNSLDTSSSRPNRTDSTSSTAIVDRSAKSTENSSSPGNPQLSRASIHEARASSDMSAPIQVSGDRDQVSRDISPSTGDSRRANFDEFWNAYPRKKAKQEARRAWDRAVGSGADPAVLIAAASRYAQQRATQDPKYTKHPATWLRAECWSDEPDEPSLRLVTGGHQPFTNPTDDAVYEEGLL